MENPIGIKSTELPEAFSMATTDEVIVNFDGKTSRIAFEAFTQLMAAYFNAGTGPAGASAYEIWLAQGNSGTEADFLASLGGGSIYTKVPLTVSGAETYVLVGRTLASNFLIIPSQNGTVKIGTSANSGDLYEFEGVANQPEYIDLINFSMAARTLHFTGNYIVRFLTVNYA